MAEELYYINSDSEIYCTEYTPPTGYVLCGKPPSEFHVWDGSQWNEDTAAKNTFNAGHERRNRDWKLRTEVDPFVSNALRWADLSTQKQSEWTQYRLDLLDVPQQSGFPNNITWPTKPE